MLNKKIFFLNFFIIIFINKDFSQTLQWKNLPNSPFYQNQRMEDIYFLNANTGWAVVISGKAFRTTNGGNSWDTICKVSSGQFRSVGFFDSQTGIIGTLRADTILYRTTNAGNNWRPITNIPNPVPLGICGISVVSENVAYACGRYDSPGSVIKTTDKGSTWILLPLDTSLAKALVDCYFWTPDSGIVVGSNEPAFETPNAVILLTSNGGSSWQKVFTSSRINEWSWKICFVSRNVGYVSMQRQASGTSNILKTINGGYNWTEIPFATYNVQGIGFVNENTGWVGGWTGPTYETTNGGSNWHLAGWGRFVNRFRFINDTLAYAVGERVYKYSKQTVGIQPSSTFIPEKFALIQNYPNPFNPTTMIKFDLRNSSVVKLIVLNALGKNVETLVNERLIPGTYSLTFDGSKYSSGIYFYRLTTDSYSESKKMLLVK